MLIYLKFYTDLRLNIFYKGWPCTTRKITRIRIEYHVGVGGKT